MTWIEEMKAAMKLMKAACAKNEEWADCWNCPFDTYCSCIEACGYGTPEDWFKKEEG